MLRIGNIGYNPNNYSARSNKRAQVQPGFKAITAQKAFEIGRKHDLPGYRAQQLIDMAKRIAKQGLDAFKKTPTYKKQIKNPEMKEALQALFEHN